MSIPTADNVRNRTLLVSIPGPEDWQIKCRCPDAVDLIAQGALPLDVYGDALERLQALVESEGLVIDNRPIGAADGLNYFRVINIWACAAAVSPRLVLTEDEALADPTALWIEDLAFEVRVSIVRATKRGIASPRLKTAVAEFRRQHPHGDSTGQSSPAVRDAPVGAAANA